MALLFHAAVAYTMRVSPLYALTHPLGAVLLGFGIFLLHRQVERRIDQIGKL